MRALTTSSFRTRTACSVLAMATALVVGPSPAAAQSFDAVGSIDVNGGAGTGIATGAGTTTITLNPGQSVVNWTPTDNAINNNVNIAFQTGGTATFQSSGDFAVLNNINVADTTRAIILNGTIRGQITGGPAPVTGGSIYFYTPGGFVLGASSIINVGSLVLSASPIAVNGSNEFIVGADRTVTFGQALNANAQISTSATTQITAANEGSYVAMVAPRVVHNGAITVNGQAALVAAEAATISFKTDGLFDITVDAGTTSTFGVSVNGDIGGPASGGAGDNHRIYAVAVPKNQALTMVFGSNADLGFNVAGAADVDGNAIVLSAGQNIANGQAATVAAPGGGTGEASISTSNITTTSAFTAVAKTDASIGTTLTRTMASDVTVKAGREARIVASTATGNLTIAGNVIVSADKDVAAGTTGTAGSAAFYADGGAVLTAQNNLTISADATGADSAVLGVNGGNAIGGSVFVQGQFGGTVNVFGTVLASATGQGGDALASGVNGGTGRGGSVQLETFGANSVLDINGHVFASADGTGGSANCIDCTGVGGAGNGGTIFVGAAADSDGSTVTLGDNESFVFLNAEGFGGSSAGGVAGGTGTGGTVWLWSQGINSQVTIAASLGIVVDGRGGNAAGAGVDGGLGDAGGVFVLSSQDGSSLTVNGQTTISADGYGGDGIGEGCQTCDGDGGNGLGGEVQLSTGAGAPGASLTFLDAVVGSASGYGGVGINGGNGTGGGGTGTGAVGISTTFAAGTTIQYNSSLLLSANGQGGTAIGGDGGDGTGGRAFTGAQAGATGGSLTVNGATLLDAKGLGGYADGNGIGGTGRGGQSDNGGNSGTVNYGTVVLTVDGTGGSSSNGTGGDGFGGQAWVEAFGAIVNVTGNYTGNARGFGGGGNVGGLGDGGLIIAAATSNDLTITGDVFLIADARGGYAYVGTGGNALGGDARINATNGRTVDIGGGATVSSQAFGGSAFGINGIGGNATGGISQLFTSTGAASTINIANQLFVNASGFGGSGAEGASFQGGNGTGGQARILANTGPIDIGASAYLNANGYGGNASGGSGGVGTGGTTRVFAQTGSVTAGNNIEDGLYLSALGQGGDAYNAAGGNGVGGFNTVEVNGTGSIGVTGSILINGSATGGDGATGGSATGRTTTGNENVPDAGTVVVRGGGSITATGSLTMNADAQGGNGTYADGNGGAGGSASAGELDIIAAVGTITVDSVTLSATAFGGDGGLGANGGNATGGLFDVTFDVVDGAINGTLNLGDVSITANAFGGDGGDGIESATGGNGGNGGNGSTFTMSVNQFSASAAGGTINAGNVNISLQAQGGAGGTGGLGSNGAGGNGGNGGAAQGGSVQTGSISNSGIASSGGAFTIGDLLIDASIFGGAGGAGGDGTTTGGNGGDGGDAGTVNTGSAFLGIRGVVGTVGDVGLYANSTGGGGGSAGTGTNANGTGGNGGDAVGGRIAVESRERFGFPAQRGTLNAGAIYGEAIALGGIGLVNGTSTGFGNSSFLLYNGDATIDSFQFVIQADTPAATRYDFIAVVDGTATINGTFSFSTSNALTLYANRANPTLDQASLTATTIALTAWDFIPQPLNAIMGPELDPATNPGTFFADTFDITTDNDFYTTATLDSVNFFEIIAPGSITTGNIVGDDAVYLDAQSGSIDTGDIDSTNEIRLDAALDITTGNLDSSDYYIFGTAGGAISVGNVDSSDFTYFSGDDSISYVSIISGDSVSLNSGGLIQGGDITASDYIYAFTNGSMDVGNLSSGNYVELFAEGDIDLGNATAAETIDIATHYPGDIESPPINGGYIHAGNLTAGDTIEVDAGTNAELGNLSAGIVNPSTNEGAEYNIGVLAGDYITAGDINSANHAGLAAPGDVSALDVNVANIFMVLAGGNISLGSVNAGANVYLADFSMMDLGGTLGNGGEFDPDPILAAVPVRTDGNITIAGPVIAGKVQAAAMGVVTAQNIDSDSSIYVVGTGGVNVGDLAAGLGIGALDVGQGSPIQLFSATSIAAGDISTDGYVGLYSGGSIAVGAIDAGHDVIALAGTDAGFGAITTPERFILAGYANYPSLFTPGFDPAQIFLIGEPQRTGGTATFGGDADVGNFEAYVGGNLTAQNVDSAANIRLDSLGNVQLGNLIAGTEIDIEADGSIDGGNMDAGVDINANAGGDITLGNLVAGFGEGLAEDTFSIGIASEGNITVGDVNGAQRVGFAALGDFSSGDIQSGWDIMLLIGGSVTTGALTSGEGDNVYIADVSMCETGGGCADDDDSDFDPDVVLALDPVETGSSITIGGPVTTGTFRAATDGDLTTGDIDANVIRAFADGTAILNGTWSANEVLLVSNDIDIGAQGGIDAGDTGSIVLQAVADGGAVIGDGVTGGGEYRLSNAEFGRITGGNIDIVVGGRGGDADTLIGDLTVTGPLVGSNIESNDGGLTFTTLSEAGDEVDGTLRVVGDIVATGFGADNYIAFQTQNFELDAATGLISITGTGNTLSGYLSIAADRIHVAEGSLLDQLAEDPQFDGYRDALNAPAATQRPDGVIRAGGIDIEFLDVGNDTPHTLYVQNMGTADVPAGFVVTDADIGDDGEQDLPPGSIDMVINGQIVTETGTLTGIAVRDLLVAEFGTDIFVAGSTINGCELTGSCGGDFIEELPPATNTTPPIIAILNTDPLGEMNFGNEPDIDDSVPGDVAEKSSPISPPQPLFDTSPLDPESDVNDPVSGAGNPSLYGVSSDEDEDDDDEEGNGKTGDGQKGGGQ